MTPKTNLKIVFGSMTIGREGAEGIRVSDDEQDIKAILDVFQRHAHTEIDSARVYGDGSSEEYLGKLGWQKFSLVMQTKLYPTAGKSLGWLTKEEYSFRAEDVRRGLMNSLKALQTDKIDMFYLHGPDRSTPLETTLAEVDRLHKEGYFTRFGISNFMAWEVAKMCELCKKNDWIKPGVYQGVYNVLHRAAEGELAPCLRHYGISWYAFQPLAGGLLTGRYNRDIKDFEEGSRFDPNRNQGKLYHARYWNDATFDALDIIRAACNKHDLTEIECALRWVSHHSMLKKEYGDAIIIGASSARQLEQNLSDLEKGPLPDDVVEALDSAYHRAKGELYQVLALRGDQAVVKAQAHSDV